MAWPPPGALIRVPGGTHRHGRHRRAKFQAIPQTRSDLWVARYGGQRDLAVTSRTAMLLGRGGATGYAIAVIMLVPAFIGAIAARTVISAARGRVLPPSRPGPSP